MGSWRIPLSIMSLAVLLSEVSGSSFGAGRIRVLTFVDAGSRRDLFTQRLAMTPVYLPLLSRTAITGGSSFLNSSRHLESGSSSLTVANFLEHTSRTRMLLIIIIPLLVIVEVEFKPIKSFVLCVWGFVCFCFFLLAVWFVFGFAVVLFALVVVECVLRKCF